MWAVWAIWAPVWAKKLVVVLSQGQERNAGKNKKGSGRKKRGAMYVTIFVNQSLLRRWSGR